MPHGLTDAQVEITREELRNILEKYWNANSFGPDKRIFITNISPEGKYAVRFTVSDLPLSKRKEEADNGVK